MRKYTMTIATAALVATATPSAAAVANAGAAASFLIAVSAQSYVEVIGMLEESGYRVTGMKSTLLGRIKILAQNREHLREVVVSRSTGEIKSDRIIRVFASGSDGDTRPTPAGSQPSNGPTSSGSGSGGVSVSVGGGGGVNVGVGSGGVSASVGGSGGIGASVGGGGINANVGGLSVGLGG
ncbi:MAG: hypothetical protein HKP29_03415 [Silicimonas sp.]|nr:hypothetical protein [Silicimonas sp.]NND22986.1 hypothetical protein [Silicimonas sp.]NNL72393.1 hypothetical protein [Silicimonas sp.]RZW07596.1 MAG: hypothetical protein EX266_06250 [Paracoccaceae bacterium]